MSTRSFNLFLFLLFVLLFPALTHAATLFVANDGEDVNLCGTRAEPCRTISQAIANSNRGDRIVVGPGIYGDTDFDGDLDRDHEENALETDDAMIEISKPVRLLSRDGAASTIIHVGEGKNFAISIAASNVTIGGKKKGFTIRGGAISALFIQESGPKLVSNTIYSDFGDGARVGCYDTNDDDEDEFFGSSTSGTVVNSVFNHSQRHGLVLCSNTGGWSIRRSQASYNTGRGFVIEGEGHKVTRTIAGGNGSAGLWSEGGQSLSISQFVSSANGGSGIATFNEGVLSIKNSAFLGNRGSGVFSTGDVTVSNSSLFGNNSFDSSGLAIPANCGVFSNSVIAPVIDKNYWGSPDGPQSFDPADDLCSQTSSPVVNTFLQKERRVRTSQPIQ